MVATTTTAQRHRPPQHKASKPSDVRPLLRRKLRRDLRTSRWQVAAVLVTIVLGVMLFEASFDSFRNITASYNKTYDDLSFAHFTVSGGDQEQFATAAAGVDGVESVAQRLQADVPTLVPRDGDEHALVGRLAQLPGAGEPVVNDVDVLTGERVPAGSPDEVLVEQHMATHFKLEPGDTLTVLLAQGPTEVTVVGTAASPEYLWVAKDRQELITLPDEFGVLFADEALLDQAPAEAQVPQVVVRYADDADADALDAELAALAQQANAEDYFTQAEQPSDATLKADLAGLGEMAFMFPALFLTGAGFATFIILNRIVATQRGQIGVLMASGLGRREVLRHYLGYGLTLGVVGALIGIVLGVPLGMLLTSVYTGLLSIPDTVVQFHWSTPVIGLLFGVAAGLLSAWAPARAAVRVPPAQAMRGEIPEKDGTGASIYEKLVPPLRRAPVRIRIGLRGIGRHKTRSASTVGGVSLAIILVLVSWGLIDTVGRMMDRQFEVISVEDAQVYLTVPVDAAVVSDIEAVDGVAVAEPVVSLSVTLKVDGDQYATSVQGFSPDTAMHAFIGLDGERIELPTSGILVGQATRDVLGVDEGDPVTVSAATLGADIETTISGFVDEPLGTYAYADQDWLRDSLERAGVAPAQLSSPSVAAVFVTYEEDADGDEVRAALEDRDDVIGVVNATALKDLFDQYFNLFYAFVGIMLVLGGILAFALIFNMITASLAERAAEIATMRASGMSIRQVNQMLTVENVLLTVVGIPVGLLLGYLTASVFMASFSSDLFSFDLDMNPLTLVWTALAVLVVALLSQIPGMRAIRRLEIATVVRQRSL